MPLEKTMVRVFLFLLFFFQPVESLASGSFSLPESPAMESSPQSKEIKKIAKLLENPQEREKLLKTLKILAAAQEAEEKKKGTSLVAYITPIIQLVMDSTSVLIGNLKKIPDAVDKFIDYIKIEKNREDFWTALLMWLPILMLIEVIFERIHLWLLRRAFEVKKLTEKAKKLADSRMNHACTKLFVPFLYPMLFLPLYVTNDSVRNWIIGFWVVLFMGRLFLLEKKALPILAIGLKEKHPFTTNLLRGFVVGVSVILLFAGLALIEWKAQNGQDFFLTPVLLMSFPLFVLWLREWYTKRAPGCLDESSSLSTVPKKLAAIINICIWYLPLLLLVLMIPLVVDWVFFEGNLAKAYGIESVVTLVILGIFLEGRRHIDGLVKYKMPKFQAVKAQAFTSYMAPLRVSLIKSLQWAWYFSFFAGLMAIWSPYFSDSFAHIISHPLMKTVMTIAIIWGIIYLLWLGLDFFVQFHTKPQTIKGKRREPTAFAKTFGPMLHSVARWIMALVTIFVTLESFGFDLKILVYLMSAFAFAISLGSQSLVKDIINGFFALVDGSFAVGDVVTVGAYTGAVESLSLRAITLRHSTGFLQTIPFSEVGSIINKSRGYNVIPIDVATSYKTNIGSVHEALTKAAEDMRNDPHFGKMILEPIKISGIDRFVDNAVHVSASIKILPDPNNYFTREFNRRLKIHLDALKIIPPISFQEPWEKA